MGVWKHIQSQDSDCVEMAPSQVHLVSRVSAVSTLSNTQAICGGQSQVLFLYFHQQDDHLHSCSL